MPNNNPNFFITEVSGDRLHSLVPHASHIGHTISLAENNYSVFHRTKLEFCFRISSNEHYAEDEIDQQIYRTGFPHLLIKYPGTRHKYRTRSPRTAYFVIYPAETVKIFELAGFDLLQFACPFKITPEIKSLLDELRKCEKSLHEPGISDRVDLIAARLISEVIMQNRKLSQIPLHHNKIRQIATFMESHLNEKLDCRTLASRWGMSLRTFFRYWHEVYQETPSHFLLMRRMEFAKHLLLRSNMDINQTAESSGFSSTAYFIHAFKRHFGTTPAAFRRLSEAQ